MAEHDHEHDDDHGHLKLEYQPALPLPNGKLFMWLFLSTEIMFFAALIGQSPSSQRLSGIDAGELDLLLLLVLLAIGCLVDSGPIEDGLDGSTARWREERHGPICVHARR